MKSFINFFSSSSRLNCVAVTLSCTSRTLAMAFFLFEVVCYCYYGCCYVRVFNSPQLLCVFEVYGVMAFVLDSCASV